MSRNVTIRLDEDLIKKCRHAAVEAEKSLSQWIADELAKIALAQDARESVRERALQRLQDGFSMGGKPLTRDEIYAE